MTYSFQIKFKLVKFYILFIGVILFQNSNGQVINGYNEFIYQNGKTSSEGFMEDGQPVGYWKTYYENGLLKSEGNRVNSKLDSIWKFYSEDGNLNFTVEYENGLKNGFRKYFNKEAILIKEQFFINDTLQDSLKIFHQTGELAQLFFYKDGVKVNKSYSFDTTGRIVAVTNYTISPVKTIPINRFSNNKRKEGLWMGFYDDLTVKWEVNYNNGLKNGVERKYDFRGNLLSIEKYQNGSLIKDVKNLQKIDVKHELSTAGTIAKSGGYNEQGEPHGVHRKYDSLGTVVASKIFNNGVLVGEGIVKKNGKKNGFWKLYYASGELQSEGNFKNGVSVGLWKYYYPNNQLESEITYDNSGKKQGIQKDYLDNGQLLASTEWIDDYENGLFVQYNDSGEVVAKGNYKDGYEDGEWYYKWGDHKAIGKYSDGNKVGEWRHYYFDKQLVFRGSFQNGLPVGKHIFWFENGNLKKMGIYSNGRKEGEWLHYTKGGSLLMSVVYENGLQRAYNGYRIDPEHTPDDYIEYNETGYE